jgi:hypothetical protein
MLNELFALERGLAAAGATVGGRHPDIKDMAKSGVIRVRLREDGTLATIEPVAKGERGALWTLRDGQHNGFPGLKLPGLDTAALAAHDAAWKTATSSDLKRTELARLIARRRDDAELRAWPKPPHRQRIRQRLAQLRSLELDPLTMAVPAAFNRFLAALDAAQPFALTLLDAFSTRVAEDEGWLDPIRGVLLGSIALSIDVASDDFDRDASDIRQIGPVSAALERSEGGAGTANRQALCAFTGTAAYLLDGNFPQPNLPGLGQTYLFARNKDIPAVSRYGRTGTASLSIGTELAGRLSGAILAATSPEREGKTWRLIPAETGDKQDLFVATVAADTTAALADGFATEEDVAVWPALGAAGSAVLRQFDGLATSGSPQTQIRLLVLRTVDPANRKAIYDRGVTVEVLHARADRWKRATQNTPKNISFLVSTKSGAVARGAPAMPPLSLVSISRTLFANGGRRRVDVIGVEASEALGLFLDETGLESRAHRVLTTLLKRHQPLIAGLAHAKARGREGLTKFDPKFDLRRDALRSIAWIGTLLHILERPKEIYMTDTAFRLGQLLSAADAVHIGYCADLRGGDAPPTLLGNAVFAIAGRDPVRALDVLQGRWKPYGAWARRADQVNEKATEKLKKNKDDRLAWNMRRGLSQARLAGPLCAELQTALRETPVDHRFRAELLLGYVAGLERPAKPNDGEPAASADNAGDAT